MKSLILVLFILIVPFQLDAQKKDKIKGDKEVVSTSGEIKESFDKLEVSDNITVEIQNANRNSYVLTADQNLLEEVEIEVRDETLKISTKSKITSSKKLYLNLNIQDLKSLIINDDAMVKNSSRFQTDKLSMVLNNSAKIELDLDVQQTLEVYFSHNSGGKIDSDAGNILINMKNRSDLKAKFDTPNLQVNLENSADLKLDGSSKHAEYNLQDSSNLNAKKLKTQTAILNSKNRSDIHVDASKEIEIDAEGKSKIYVYGNPEIKVRGLTDKSRIIKR